MHAGCVVVSLFGTGATRVRPLSIVERGFDDKLLALQDQQHLRSMEVPGGRSLLSLWDLQRRALQWQHRVRNPQSFAHLQAIPSKLLDHL